MSDITDDEAKDLMRKLSEKPNTKARRADVLAAQLLAEKDMEIEGLLDLLRRALPHVKASCGADHMMEGFGPKKVYASDVLLADIESALSPPS